MTTNIAAAASGAIGPGFSERVRGRAVSTLLVSVALGLSGCESGTSILGGQNAPSPETQISQTAPQKPAVAQTRISIAPVIGAPDNVAKQLQSELTSAVERQQVAIATGVEKVDFTVRGYVVAAKEKSQTKVSYIWDVTDPSGKRVNRITGEEIIAGTPGKDPWSAVTGAISQQIAQKTAASFVTWLPQGGGKPAIASNAPPVGVGVTSAAPQTLASGPSPEAQNASLRQPAQGPATGSISREDLTALVPAVSGAPGDGAQSLTGAIQAELARNGVPLTSQASQSSYRVEGVVKVGTTRDGKQPIQIDWNVKDPSGKKLGTVSQKNEIPEGSLDGAWGKTADAAAAAAAQGILKLLPQKTASN